MLQEKTHLIYRFVSSFLFFYFFVLKTLRELMEAFRMELIHEGDTMRSSADVYLGCLGSRPENFRQTIWLNSRAFILCDPSSAQQLGGPHDKLTSA